MVSDEKNYHLSDLNLFSEEALAILEANGIVTSKDLIASLVTAKFYYMIYDIKDLFVANEIIKTTSIVECLVCNRNPGINLEIIRFNELGPSKNEMAILEENGIPLTEIVGDLSSMELPMLKNKLEILYAYKRFMDISSLETFKRKKFLTTEIEKLTLILNELREVICCMDEELFELSNNNGVSQAKKEFPKGLK